MRLLLAAIFVLMWGPYAAFAQAQTEETVSAHPGCLVGIITVTHGHIGRELVEVAQHVVGEQEAIVAISVMPDDDMEARRRAILDAIEQVNAGCGVIILTDMFGGTPSNLAISAMVQNEIEVVAGVNLPMLIKAIAVRANLDVTTAARTANAAGRQYINRAAELLRQQ